MVSLEIQDHIATLVMDDGKANAMNANFLEALMGGLEEARSAQAQAVVLTGRSGFFSGGLDLKTLPGLNPTDFAATVNRFEEMIRHVLDFPVPTVAAVGGHALAGGAVLLLACDLAVAGAGPFKVGLNEVAIGIPLPTFVMELARLRLAPRSWTRALVMGQSFAVEEAARVGFVDEVIAPELLMARAREHAMAAARVPQEAYQKTKQLLHRSVLEVPTGQLASMISHTFLQGGLRHNLGAKKG